MELRLLWEWLCSMRYGVKKVIFVLTYIDCLYILYIGNLYMKGDVL